MVCCRRQVPAKGTALLVTLSEGSRDTTYPGVFIKLTAPKKLRTNAGETKAMQPVNLTIALPLSDDQHNHLVNQHTLPRVSQLEVLPGGASTPLWDALLHMPRERQHVALGVPLADSPLEAIRQPSHGPCACSAHSSWSKKPAASMPSQLICTRLPRSQQHC